MKSKIKISLFVLLIIGVIVVNVLYKNKDRDDKTKPKSNLAIMIDENGNGNYTSASSIPKGSYALVEEKTVCENGGKVASYNNLTGQIGFSFLGSDRCSIYFEKISSPTISNVSVSGSTLRASFNSKKILCCYAITTSTSEPSDWTDISGSSYELSTSLTSSGTYYLWLKDSYGNVTRYEDAITLEKRGYETILINNGNGATTVEAAKNYIEEKGTPDFSTIATTNEGMYAAEDDLGTSYYFRGAVNNNWVKFGKDSSGNDIYWRIIRINGDGSIRMIYSGITAPTSSTAIVMTGIVTYISSIGINNSSSNPAYVGYMYTLGEQHGNSTSSSIKKAIDNWYKTTTLETNTEIKNLVSKNQIYCNDRSASTSLSGIPGEISGGLKTNNTYYFGASIRLSNKEPILTCPTETDMFTLSTNNLGNKKLDYPVGLITTDEVSMAGGVKNTGNSSYYLYSKTWKWIGSPSLYDGKYGLAYAHYIFIDDGSISSNSVANSYTVHPVISLSENVKLSGDGTYNNVYTVS